MRSNSSLATTAEAVEALVANDDAHFVKPEVTALEAITRSEVAMQLDSAHRWPRSPAKFLRDAISLATFSTEVAESCMYSLPRRGADGETKMITGPSVRLAEIIASSWGNLHVGARVIDESEAVVTAQAVAWDLQSNVRVTIEAQRGILTSRGKRYGEDMIRVTGMAAISIALRNAIFRVVPRSYVEAVYEKARQCAVGDVKTLPARRDDAFARFAKLGVSQDRMFARLGIKGAEDFTLEHLELLVGMYTAIKGGELPIDEAFPAPAPSPVPPGTPEGQRIKLGGKKTKETKGAAAGANPSPAPSAPAGNEGAAAPANEASGASLPPSAASAPAAAPSVSQLDDEWVEIHELLAQADSDWSARGLWQVVARWTDAERREAREWANAVVHDGDMRVQVRRPHHTILTREPGQEG